MRRILLVCLLAYSLFILGLITRSGEILTLTIPFVILLGFSFYHAPNKPKLKITRSLSDEGISPGKPILVKLKIQNEGDFLEELWVEDRIDPNLEVIEGRVRNLITLLPEGSLELIYTVRGRRGNYQLQKVHISASESTALFVRQDDLNATGKFYIKPDVWHLRSIAIRPLRTHLYSGPIPARRGGAGLNFYDVREYALGDPLRWINWKVTARHEEELYTNQFEQERVADVGIILDARSQTEVVLPKHNPGENEFELNSIFEYSIHAAAALAETFLHDGHRVGLLTYGRGQHATFPGYGKIQRERILRALAQARTGDNVALESLTYLPARFFPPHSQIVLISPLTTGDPPVLTRLLAHGYQLLVISPDPISFEARQAPKTLETEQAFRLAQVERTLLLRRLQRYGIGVINWQVNEPLERVIGSTLHRIPGEIRMIGSGL